MLPGTAYPSQTKPRNSSRLHILRRTAERKGLYFLPGNFGECNPLAFKKNSCSHSPAMLVDGPVPRGVHTRAPPRHSSGSLREKASSLQSKLLLPPELTPLANPYPDIAWQSRGQRCPGWGKHRGVDEYEKQVGRGAKRCHHPGLIDKLPTSIGKAEIFCLLARSREGYPGIDGSWAEPPALGRVQVKRSDLLHVPLQGAHVQVAASLARSRVCAGRPLRSPALLPAPVHPQHPLTPSSALGGGFSAEAAHSSPYICSHFSF